MSALPEELRTNLLTHFELMMIDPKEYTEKALRIQRMIAQLDSDIWYLALKYGHFPGDNSRSYCGKRTHYNGRNRGITKPKKVSKRQFY
jgi:hypothetical protein